MDIESIANCLRPWMAVKTWHKTQPHDLERFNKALKKAIETHGSAITNEEFRDAMGHLAQELYPHNYENAVLNESLSAYASRAEIINSFLADNGMF